MSLWPIPVYPLCWAWCFLLFGIWTELNTNEWAVRHNRNAGRKFNMLCYVYSMKHFQNKFIYDVRSTKYIRHRRVKLSKHVRSIAPSWRISAFRFRSFNFIYSSSGGAACQKQHPKQHSRSSGSPLVNQISLSSSQFPANKFVFAFPLDWNKWCHSKTFFNNSKNSALRQPPSTGFVSVAPSHTKSTQREMLRV